MNKSNIRLITWYGNCVIDTIVNSESVPDIWDDFCDCNTLIIDTIYGQHIAVPYDYYGCYLVVEEVDDENP